MSSRYVLTIVAASAATSCARAQCPGRWEKTPERTFAVVTALGALSDNRLLVGGIVDSTPQILVLDESGWTVLGTLRGDEPGRTYPASANTFLELANGDIIVGGSFTSVGGVSANSVARWDGKNWSALGEGLPREPFPHEWPGVHALLDLGGGEILAGGLFNIPEAGSDQNFARWDGQSWVGMGERVGVNHYATALVQSTDGDLFAGGTFTVRRYEDPNWISIGPLVNEEWSYGFPEFGSPLAFLHDGDLVVGDIGAVGDLDVNGITRWDGTTWHALGSGLEGSSGGSLFYVPALSVLPNGHLVAAGGGIRRAGGVEVSDIAEWDGSSWSPLGAGIGGGLALVTAVLPNGDLYVGGNFNRAGSHTVTNLALWTTRPACAADYTCDSSITSADFFAFLPVFFDGQPAADVNGDGAVDTRDFFAFIAAFFAGCG